MFYILPSIHTILVKSFLSHSFFLRRTLFFYTLVQTLYDICNSTLSAIDCERHLNPLSSSLFVNAVGRPHHNSKVWRIFGQTHSVHGTPRQTWGFLIQKTDRLAAVSRFYSSSYSSSNTAMYSTSSLTSTVISASVEKSLPSFVHFTNFQPSSGFALITYFAGFATFSVAD